METSPSTERLMNMLLDATDAGITEIDFIFDLVGVICSRYRRDNDLRGHLETHAVDITDRPTNASTRRQHAISVFLYKWADNPNFDLRKACRDLDTMATLGRTPRWKASLTDWKSNLTIAGSDKKERDYVITQYGVFANYAA